MARMVDYKDLSLVFDPKVPVLCANSTIYLDPYDIPVVEKKLSSAISVL